MRVRIGPTSSSSARAWINYGREVLRELDALPGSVPDRVERSFRSYLDEWEAVARADPVFRWEGEAPAETVEYLVNWLYRIGEQVEDAAEDDQVRLRPPEADKFHLVLVHSVLDALQHEGPSQAQFVEALRANWTVARQSD